MDRLYSPGFITRLAVHGSLASAVVRGDHGYYSVALDLETGEASCSCPGFASRRACKHVAALALYAYFENRVSEKILAKLGLRGDGP